MRRVSSKERGCISINSRRSASTELTIDCRRPLFEGKGDAGSSDHCNLLSRVRRDAADFATRGERWNIILDTVGNASFARCRDALNDNGRLLLVAGGLKQLLAAPFQSMISGRTVAAGPAPERAEDLAVLRDLVEAGGFMPVIDSRFPFERIAEAHARVDSGRKVGNVVVTMEGP